MRVCRRVGYLRVGRVGHLVGSGGADEAVGIVARPQDVAHPDAEEGQDDGGDGARPHDGHHYGADGREHRHHGRRDAHGPSW